MNWSQEHKDQYYKPGLETRHQRNEKHEKHSLYLNIVLFTLDAKPYHNHFLQKGYASNNSLLRIVS